MPKIWQQHYRPPLVTPEVEAKARDLVARAAERRGDLWANLTKEKLEAIVLAIAADLQTAEGSALWEASLRHSEGDH